MLRKIKNLIGWKKGYGNCRSCGDSWWRADMRWIKYDDRSDMLVICGKCLDKLDAEVIMEHCRRVWHSIARHTVWKNVAERVKQSVMEEKGK